jgi:hypothetical protein
MIICLAKPCRLCSQKVGFVLALMRYFWLQRLGLIVAVFWIWGAGVGGVSLCLARRLDAVQITAIEIDPVMAALAQRNVVANGFDDRLRIVHDDIVKMPPVLAGSFDHVVSNPPVSLRNRHKAARQPAGFGAYWRRFGTW